MTLPAQSCVVTIRKRLDPVGFTAGTFQGVVTTEFRIGSGHDSHRLGQGSPMCLGGVAIERAREVVAHSDGDVLLHALTDALLGAMAWGDIGESGFLIPIRVTRGVIHRNLSLRCLRKSNKTDGLQLMWTVRFSYNHLNLVPTRKLFASVLPLSWTFRLRLSVLRQKQENTLDP